MMKRIITLMVGALASTTSYGDDLPRNWAKATDGYVWPASPKGAPVFKLQGLKVEELDAGFQKIATTKIKGFDEKAPKYASIAKVDLDGDGKSEIFLRIPRLGGAGGWFVSIFTPSDAGYREIGSMQVVDVKFVEKKNGWYQIEISSRGGPSDYTRSLYSFGRDSYVMTRSESHDLAAKTMIVREIKTE